MKSKRPYKKKRTRVGRGTGSTKGKTSGRGHKGQRARTGSKARTYSEGGQNTIIRRLPKRGFNKTEKKRFDIFNLDTLTALNLKEITPADLANAGLVKKVQYGIKILAKGDVSTPLTVRAHAFSVQAKEKLEKAGGKAIIIEASSSKKI